MRKKVSLFVLTLVACVILLNTFVFAGSSTPSYKITSLKAYLFYEQRNSFSEDILADPDIALWNTIIGEGFAGSPSHSTMVVVEVTGTPGAYEPDRKIEFSCSKDGKVIFRRTATIDILSESGKYYEAFWLYDTGCTAIKLVAKIIGQSQASKIEKIIPFTCGE